MVTKDNTNHTQMASLHQIYIIFIKFKITIDYKKPDLSKEGFRQLIVLIADKNNCYFKVATAVWPVIVKSLLLPSLRPTQNSTISLASWTNKMCGALRMCDLHPGTLPRLTWNSSCLGYDNRGSTVIIAKLKCYNFLSMFLIEF